MSTSADQSDGSETIRRKAQEAIQKYFYQLTQGCGNTQCNNPICASNQSSFKYKELSRNQAAALAINLAKDKSSRLCGVSETSDYQLKSPKQFKAEEAHNSSDAIETDEPEMSKRTPQRLNQAGGDDDENFFDDDDDVIISRPTSGVVGDSSSSAAARIGSSSSRTAANASTSGAPDWKSLNEALENAVKYATNKNVSPTTSKSSSGGASQKELYLSENRINNLIKKCKSRVSEMKKEKQSSRMETDQTDDQQNVSLTLDEYLKCYHTLFSVIQRAFQSYKSLALSFRNDTTTNNSSASATPTQPPLDIDMASLRRSYSLLYSTLSQPDLIDELERCIDMSVYALCISIRMLIKKPDIKREEVEEMLNALLIVNELPIMDNPQYISRCIKIFYATISELESVDSVKIVTLWSKWHADELKVYLNRAQQYISVCIMKKLEEDELKNMNDEDDDDEDTEKTCLHKNEGITGAVGYLRLIYYASILGGRTDPNDQVEQERQIEREELKYYEDVWTLEEQQNNESGSAGSLFAGENQLVLPSLYADQFEQILNIRVVDCREPKIPPEQFVNELANEHIDIQHDYVEYAQLMQYLETQRGNGASKTRKHIFAYLAHPFFLVLGMKNLGLYYDNKIKMMRERRNNIMMSLIEGRMPTPYFKMRLTRQNLLFDALSLIEIQEQENPATLRKQLFIEFENEQGIDQGGISKEFFQLAIDELLNRGYTFFVFDEKTSYYWISPCTLETEKEFRLVGILFGIAIYNNVLLDVQFPPVFFRKLMGKLGTFEDLKHSHPEQFSSLNSLLQFDGSEEEFQDTFMQTFQVSLTDNFGTPVNFNLKENGDKTPVTKENRQEFVELYADFLLNKGIDESFKAFRRGFLKIIMNSPLMKWYSPTELEILLCGTQVMDWNALEHSTSYDSGFDSSHTYIKHFWEVFKEFTDEQKKQFLKFTTGTDRCPHGGLKELKLTIARNGPDSEKLPTAHTCFNVLLLPEYSSPNKLKEKLLKAIQYSRGFGLS